MPRTTVDIDRAVLKELRELQRERGKSLGRLISDLLLEAIPRVRARPQRKGFTWQTATGALKVELLDKDAIYAALDRKARGAK